jgi:hypothetical protein
MALRTGSDGLSGPGSARPLAGKKHFPLAEGGAHLQLEFHTLGRSFSLGTVELSSGSRFLRRGRRVPFSGLLVFWIESVLLGLAQHFSGHPLLRIALN